MSCRFLRSTTLSPFGSYRSAGRYQRSEEHTSELQSQSNIVCRLLLEKKNKRKYKMNDITCFVLFRLARFEFCKGVSLNVWLCIVVVLEDVECVIVGCDHDSDALVMIR